MGGVFVRGMRWGLGIWGGWGNGEGGRFGEEPICTGSLEGGGKGCGVARGYWGGEWGWGWQKEGGRVLVMS